MTYLAALAVAGNGPFLALTTMARLALLALTSLFCAAFAAAVPAEQQEALTPIKTQDSWGYQDCGMRHLHAWYNP